MRKLTVSEMNRVSGGDGAVHVARIGAQANRGSIMAGGFAGAISGAASGALNGMGVLPQLAVLPVAGLQ